VAGCRLVPFSALPAAVSMVGAVSPVSSEYQQLLSEFPTVCQPFSVVSSPSHGVKHQIVMMGHPATVKFCCLDPVRLPGPLSRSSRRCCGLGLLAVQAAAGPVLPIWLRRKTAAGSHVGIFAASISRQQMISTPFPIWETCLVGFHSSKVGVASCHTSGAPHHRR
jgi:hypothetical protein